MDVENQYMSHQYTCISLFDSLSVHAYYNYYRVDPNHKQDKLLHRSPLSVFRGCGQVRPKQRLEPLSHRH